MSQIKDLTGQRFGILTALHIDESSKGGIRLKWVVKCDCGVVKSVFAINLNDRRRSGTKSCGCRGAMKIRGSKLTCMQLADFYNVSYSTIAAVKKYKTWA